MNFMIFKSATQQLHQTFGLILESWNQRSKLKPTKLWWQIIRFSTERCLQCHLWATKSSFFRFFRCSGSMHPLKSTSIQSCSSNVGHSWMRDWHLPQTLVREVSDSCPAYHSRSRSVDLWSYDTPVWDVSGSGSGLTYDTPMWEVSGWGPGCQSGYRSGDA